MQERHINRQSYFYELAQTSRDFYIDYLGKFIHIQKGMNVLEIGCGEGGNLLPFAELGCNITGIDRSMTRIAEAESFFYQAGFKGEFFNVDFFDIGQDMIQTKFDIILVHDVIEHIDKNRKVDFAVHAKTLLAKDGVIFWGFPAWQMPFGGHQQICRHKIGSKLPFIHLLPKNLYKICLRLFGESDACINELLDIKSCKVSIEHFERIIKESNGIINDRILWFINPHYKQKFNLKPKRLLPFMAHFRYIRNYFCTACFYITQ